MCQAKQTADAISAGSSLSTKQNEMKATGPLVVEVVQYDNESRFGCGEVVIFDVSS